MTLGDAFSKYVEVLLDQWLWDVSCLSEPWMYYWLLVPALCFLMFMTVKWSVLTMPIWLPVSLALRGLKGLVQTRRGDRP